MGGSEFEKFVAEKLGMIDGIAGDVRDVKATLNGKDGLVVRVEQAEARRNFLTATALVALIGAAVQTGWNKLTGRA